MSKFIVYITTALLITSHGVFAETLQLYEYLSKLNSAEVSFSGRIKYDKSSLNDADFTYYNSEGEPFAVTVDAGRKAREEIQEKCANSGFMVSLKDLCVIEGLGTVEIRGSRIYLSIDTVTKLSK